MAEILGRQERVVSMIANNGANFGQQQQQPTGQHNLAIDTIRRDEVSLLINQQNELVTKIRDI